MFGCQGLTRPDFGMPLPALRHLETDQLSTQEASTVSSLITLAWCLRPLWALVSDSFPIAGLRREPYILAGLLGAALCWAGLATATNPSMLRYCACRVGIEIC